MSAQLQAKDFASSQEVRWCPGCGDYAVLKSVTKALADVGAVPEKTVFVSGIGCSSRFPYYLETYGFHTIHGRAPAIATGLKLANPELDVWVVTGDGDGLSIGGNHLLHALRRNVGFKILLFNNEIYGLTKGQYSPTSRPGTRSPSSPAGSFDSPVSPGAFALGAGAKFIARAIDVDKTGLGSVLAAAHGFDGAAFVEIFQNCIVYNDGVFNSFTERDKAADAQLRVEHGLPLVFGEGGSKGLAFDAKTMTLKVVDAKANANDVLVHDETNRTLAQLLLTMPQPEFPVALGVVLRQPGVAFEKAYYANQPTKLKRTGKVADALRQTSVWRVPAAKQSLSFASVAGSRELGGRAFGFAPDAEQIAAPDLADIPLAVAARFELGRHVRRFGRIGPARDAAAAVEVGADADVVDADQLDRVIDVIDEVCDGRRRPTGRDRRASLRRSVARCSARQRARPRACREAHVLP